MKLKNTSTVALKDTSTLAVCSFVGQLNSNEPQARVQLLPDGFFSAKDGRPFNVPSRQWLLDAQAYQTIVASAKQRANPYPFDYEHQTLLSEDNGKPAPAAGWWAEFDYVPGEGLFAINPDWTNKARDFIKNGEYRYLSAVFNYDPNSGRVTEILHAALTNDPALDGMQALAALKRSALNHTKEHSMTEALQLLLSLIGVSTTDIDLNEAAALKKLTTAAQTALAALKTKAAQVGDLQTELSTAQAALKVKSASQDPMLFVPRETYDAVIIEMAALKVDSSKTADELIAAAKAEGRMLPEADVAYLKQLGETNGMAALKTALAGRPIVAALKNGQTQGKSEPEGKDQDKGELSKEELAVCKTMGISAADFKKSKGASA